MTNKIICIVLIFLLIISLHSPTLAEEKPDKDDSQAGVKKPLDSYEAVRRAMILLPVKTTLIDVEPKLFTVKIIGDIE